MEDQRKRSQRALNAIANSISQARKPWSSEDEPEEDVGLELRNNRPWNPQCKTCALDSKEDRLPGASVVRRQIEDMWFEFWSIAAIEKQIAGLIAHWSEEDRPSYSGIRRHLYQHVPWRHAMAREAIEKRAEARGISVEEAIENLATARDVVDTLFDSNASRLLRGAVKVESVNEFVALAKLKRELEESEAERFSGLWYRSRVGKMAEAMRKVMPPELWFEFIDAMREEDGSLPMGLEVYDLPIHAIEVSDGEEVLTEDGEVIDPETIDPEIIESDAEEQSDEGS